MYSKDGYDRHFFPMGHYIFKEGEPAEVAYLIESGAVEVIKTAYPSDLPLTELKSGEIFGEMGVLVDGARTASVKALTDCHLIVINRETFEAKLAKSDAMVRSIVGMLSRRVIAANEALAAEVNAEVKSEG